MKKIAVFGATGSIGTQSLQVIRENPDRFRAFCLTCGRNTSLFEEQLKEFKPEIAVTQMEEDAIRLSKSFPETDFLWGREGLKEAAKADYHVMLNGLVGIMGLEPTYMAVKTGKDIALANKETLVAGGAIIEKATCEAGVKLLPVDSEHSAIFQCIEGNEGRKIKKILLTCSGGPFRGKTLEELEAVTLEQALNHPKWSMGPKITVDSATLMNKGLEVIEAKWLFNVEPAKIQVLIHPQSILHSAVEYMDNSVIGQMGLPDMKIPISLALGYPDRISSNEKSLNFFEEASRLTFERPDTQVFKCLELAYRALEAGGSCGAALNGANEALVGMFLEKKIRFIEIQRILDKFMEGYEPVYNADISGILEIDREARIRVAEMAK